MLSHSEENYLKEIFHLSGKDHAKVSTNSLADKLDSKASSITDMLKKLGDKKLVSYEKYKGCSLTAKGEKIAIHIIRKHRLWETFLVNKLNFGWDEVHDVAEQLEHIQSLKLINGIDQFLNYPKVDPHGDPIPDKDGNINYLESKIKLSDTGLNTAVEVVQVNEDSFALLQYLDQIKLGLGSRIIVKERIAFDESITIELNEKTTLSLSKKISENISVKYIAK
ncbi:MAG: metal-dependent transcriptional regulator [Crocinitomicaceae bacterium]